jgi:HK97 family phage portal protein
MRIFSSTGLAEEDAGSRDPASDFWFTPLGMKTVSGARVTPDTAMTVAAMFACVRIIAETVGSLPCNTYRRLLRGKEIARKHELYRLLRYQPNEQQTPVEFFEMLTAHTALRGNGYAEKAYNGRGELEQLIPLHPDCVRVDELESGRLGYLYTDRKRGVEYRYTQDEIFHLRGFTLDGRMGMSVLQAAAGSIGTAMAADEYAARFFANDASPRGVLTHPSHFADKERRTDFRKQWQQAQTGANRHKTAILEDGMKYEQLGLSNADSQLIESRRYQIADIARFFRVPLVLLGETEKSTSWGSGIEQFMLAFVTHTMRPWFVRWEQRIQSDLILGDPETGDDEFFIEFQLNALTRGDMKTRFESYSKGILDGWLTRNEARDGENMNPLDGLDEPLQPMNMQGANAVEPEKPPRKTNQERTEGDHVDARAAQVVRKEVVAITRALERSMGRGTQAFHDGIARFYGGHAGYLETKLGVSREFAVAWCEESRLELVAASSTDGTEVAEIHDVLAAWEPARAHELAIKARQFHAE